MKIGARARRMFVVGLAAIACVLGLLVAVVPAATAASGPIFTVMNTSETLPDGVWFRNSPRTADTSRITGLGVYRNERVQLQCYAFGDAVGSYRNSLWYYTNNVTRPTNNGQPNVGFLNAHYVNDGRNANVVSAGVPACVNNAPPAAPPPAPTPIVTLAQGPAAPAGYRYAITLANFSGNSSVSISCRDSVSPNGFYTFSLTTNANGQAFTQSYCYSGDGPDHWVVANGSIESNHVSWGGSSTNNGGGGTTPTPPGGGGGSTGGGTGGATGGSQIGYTPTHIQLRSDAGTRERNLLKLAPNLNKAASTAAIPGQTLAHIIYHEGGNYLGAAARKSATQRLELGYSGSVGIGQIKVETAKLVALKIYRDFETVNNEDIVVRTKLIYDTDYSLKYAAGYVKLLQQAGISGDFQLFMSYNLSVDLAKAWKARSYSMTPSVLTAIGINANVFKARKTSYDQAVRAIS